MYEYFEDGGYTETFFARTDEAASRKVREHGTRRRLWPE